MPNVKYEDNNFPRIETGLVVVYRKKHRNLNHPLGHAGEQRQVSAVSTDYVDTIGPDGDARGSFRHDEFWWYFEPLSIDNAHDGPAISSKPATDDPDAPMVYVGDGTITDPVQIVAEVVAPEEAAAVSSDEIAQSLREWWLDTASEEVEPLIAKMFEYGGVGRSNDLTEIGYLMQRLGVPTISDRDEGNSAHYAAELGIFFYIEGKMARWSAAIAEGRPVSDDTLLDIGIYVRMVQRIRAVGGWPV